MIRDAITVHRPTSLTQACALLDDIGPEATVLGGGSMLVPKLTRGERRVSALVDLRRLVLDQVDVATDYVQIGAMATYSTLLRADRLTGAAGLLRQMAQEITGGSQIRNLGTVGGSASYANPASDVPGVLVALQAQMVVRSSAGERALPAEEFFVGSYQTALHPGEILVAVRVRHHQARTAYIKVKAGGSGWPVVTAAALVDGDSAALTIGAAEAVPVRIEVPRATLMQDSRSVMDLVRAAIRAPLEDAQGTAAYRQHVAGVLARRVLEGAEHA
jgi:carbon-monoxide dehydrogenase medium subunit